MLMTLINNSKDKIIVKFYVKNNRFLKLFNKYSYDTFQYFPNTNNNVNVLKGDFIMYQVL